MDVIVQALPVGDDKVGIWYKTDVDVAGVQYECTCTDQGRGQKSDASSSKCGYERECECGLECADSGLPKFLPVIDGISGAATENGFSISTGTFVGKWLAFSLSGTTLPTGYFNLAVLLVEELETCVPGSFGLTGGVNSDLNVGTERVWNRIV